MLIRSSSASVRPPARGELSALLRVGAGLAYVPRAEDDLGAGLIHPVRQSCCRAGTGHLVS